mgnify:CR=1 FL=1
MSALWRGVLLQQLPLPPLPTGTSCAGQCSPQEWEDIINEVSA